MGVAEVASGTAAAGVAGAGLAGEVPSGGGAGLPAGGLQSETECELCGWSKSVHVFLTRLVLQRRLQMSETEEKRTPLHIHNHVAVPSGSLWECSRAAACLDFRIYWLQLEKRRESAQIQRGKSQLCKALVFQQLPRVPRVPVLSRLVSPPCYRDHCRT